ncbi:MAG: hypothetical protein ACP5RP_03225 [Candidatus Micrarchaeia archaeon]
MRLYEALSKFDEADFRDVEDAIRDKLLIYGKGSKAIILDVNDTYFEGKSVTGRLCKGKEDKVKKLLQIALTVTKQYGFPLLHKIYGGNILNIKISYPLMGSKI